MKKIINKLVLILTVLMLLVNSVTAQLPLIQGDAVVTHSQNNGSGSGGSIVLRVIRTNNTTTAPLGANWNTATMTSACPAPGTKPGNWNASNWTQGTLGNIFGITLDNQTNPDIYVSNTQIYSGSNLNASKIWRLDGSLTGAGANSLVFNFANQTRSLGNLKYLKLGSTENIYVSNFDNGFIERLNGNSGSNLLWSHQTPFNPKFGLPNDNPQYLPYGLAVRNIGSGNYRLYYAKISLTTPFNTNEIWSVDLDPIGDFRPATEQQEVFPTASLSTYPGTVISDIAFPDDGKKMLVAQQTFKSSFGSLCAHRSNVAEFITQVTDHNWNASPNLFQAGASSGFQSDCGKGEWNSVGGVSYSNNVLKGDKDSLSCESTVWFSSDLIVFNPSSTCFAYGIQGMNANGGALNAVSNSVLIDQDDYTVSGDKMQIGDVEVYKKSLNCNPCKCGSWVGNPTLNNQEISGQYVVNYTSDGLQKNEAERKGDLSIKLKIDNKIIETTISELPILAFALPKVYPIQFVLGNISGAINATYQCNGNCGATYTWNITNDATKAVVANGTTLPIDLSQYNSLFKCGKYTLLIKAKCGNSDCGSLTIPITIICEPPGCCKAKIDIKLTKSSVNAVTNIPNSNAYSSAAFGYNLDFSLPMSEIRVSVEGFNLISNSPNCLNCNNRPVTWGNILRATLNGNSMTLSGLVGPSTGSLPADYREAVYNKGTPITPPSA